jgi:acyl CoA:acetate/3-ketoacid CoA transferase beta subunit
VRVASTADLDRRTTLVTDLALFEVGAPSATLVGLHPWASEDEVRERTGFAFARAPSVAATAAPDAATLAAIRAIDTNNLRQSLVG